MTRCTRCHRPLSRPTESGMGRVCEKRSAPAPRHERDLFGYSIALAVDAARQRLAVHIESLTVDAQLAIRAAFRQARTRLGVLR